jgi:hypothetical protein
VALLNNCLWHTVKWMYKIHFHITCITVALTDTVFIKEKLRDRRKKQ